jgi:hypothetical protein
MARTNKRSGSTAQFPVRLYDMMAFVQTQGLESVIGWVLGGRGFMIHDPSKLVDVLPLFFGQTKHRSFLRQLNMWDFDRISQGPNKGTYMHPYFVKGNRELCGQMSRHIRQKVERAPPRRQQVSSGSSHGELGSFKSEVAQGSHRLNPSTDSSNNLESTHSTTSTSTSALPASDRRTRRRQTTTEENPTKRECGDTDFFCKSYNAFSSWLLPMSQDGLNLDLEPSPIMVHPTRTSSTTIVVAAIDDIMKDFILDEEERCSIVKASAYYSADEIINSFLSQEDQGEVSSCFAGKRFFLVEDTDK